MAIANLAMYDMAERRAATDRWWRGLAKAMDDQDIAGVPDALDRTTPLHDSWRAADLLMSQTCAGRFEV